MTLSDKYKLSFCYSTDGNSFLLDVPFIPICDIYVPCSKYASLHNGKFIKAQDLKALLSYRKRSIAITVANLMHFDLSDFILNAGVYTPNNGEFLLQNKVAAENGKIIVLPPDARDCDTPQPTNRLYIPEITIQDYYALLYLKEI